MCAPECLLDQAARGRHPSSSDIAATVKLLRPLFYFSGHAEVPAHPSPRPCSAEPRPDGFLILFAIMRTWSCRQVAAGCDARTSVGLLITLMLGVSGFVRNHENRDLPTGGCGWRCMTHIILGLRTGGFGLRSMAFYCFATWEALSRAGQPAGLGPPHVMQPWILVLTRFIPEPRIPEAPWGPAATQQHVTQWVSQPWTQQIGMMGI